MAAGGDNLGFECAGLGRSPGAGVGARGELILHFPANAVQTRQHFSGQPHHPCRLCHVTAQARVEIDAVAHRHMAHVLHAANQADAGIAGHDHACGIVQRLHGRTAQTVNRVCRYRMRDLRQQRRVTGDVKTLLEGLLYAAPVDIVYRACLKRRVARQQAAHQVRGEVLRAHVAKCAAL